MTPGTPRYVRCSQGHPVDRTVGACPICGETIAAGAVAAPAQPAPVAPPPVVAPPQPAPVQAARRPGPELYGRPKHLIWIVDCSGSMIGEKMASVNFAIRSVVPEIRNAVESYPGVQILARVVAFSRGAHWHMETPTPLESFVWTNLEAKEQAPTDLGAALKLVAEQLTVPPMPERALPPSLILVTDGQPTDSWEPALSSLLATPAGNKSDRAAIAIGSDAKLEPLEKFCSPKFKPLRPNTATEIVRELKWVSTVLAAQATPEIPRPAADANVVPAPVDKEPDGGPLTWRD